MLSTQATINHQHLYRLASQFSDTLLGKMVGSAGNAPVRRFRFYLATPVLQTGNRIASHGCGGGNRTHLEEFMRLRSVL